MPEILKLIPAEIVSQTISFFVLVFLLKRFAWKPLLAMLDQRRTRIEEGIRQVAQGKAELEHLKEDYTKRLAGIEEEARAKLQQAILEGKKAAVEIQEQARAQSYVLMNKAKETIELELGKAKISLRDQMANLTVDAVERVLRQKMDAKSDRQLVDAVLEELEREQTKA